MFTLRRFDTIVKIEVQLLVHCGVGAVDVQPWIDMGGKKLNDNLFINVKVDFGILSEETV